MLNRRELLRLGAGGLLAAGLGACDSGTPGALPTAGPTASPPVPTPTPTAQSWESFARALSGGLTRPGDPGYDRARLVFNPAFDGVRPQGVVSCRSVGEVVAGVAFARSRGLPVTARSGGHSYTGASITPGLVLDLRPLRGVTVNEQGTATIGAGALLVDVYAALATHGVSIPAGSCPTVGIGGLTLGGGYGVVSRAHGLTCDTLLAADVVLADGTLVHTSETSQPDLFWALRGGGGTAGIVTSFTFRTHPVRDVVLFALGWRWADAAAVLGAWQRWGPAAPDATFSTCKLLATDRHGGGQSPTVGVYGLHLGSAGELAGLLDDLVRQVGAAPSYRSTTPSGYQQAMLTEAGCADRTLVGCHLAGQRDGGALAREAFAAGSDFLRTPLPAAGLAALIQAVQARQDDPALIRGGTSFDAYGGAINRVSAAATAFVHRDSLAVLQHTATWNATDSAAVVAANRRSLATLQAAVRPYVSGEAYQNYLDPTRPDPGPAYFGANLSRLRSVVATYDPHGAFARPALGV